MQVGDQTILPSMVMGELRKGLKAVFTGDTAVCDTLLHAAQSLFPAAECGFDGKTITLQFEK